MAVKPLLWLRPFVGDDETTGLRSAARPMLLVVAVSLLAYASSLAIPFIWDDETHIVSNQAVHSLTNIPSFFLSVSSPPPDVEGGNIGKLDYYRPLVTTMYAIEYAAFAANPFGYHALNVLLNALVVALFLLLVREISRDPWLALGAALLYAVNPVRGEAVYWIYSLSEILMALFMLAALLLYHRRRTGGALACFGMGLFARESAILFPIVLLMYEYLIGRERSSGRFARVGPFIALAAGFLAWRGWVVGGTPAVSSVAPLTMANTAAFLVQKSLKIFLFPDAPIVQYPARLFPEATPVVWLSWVVAVGVIAGFFALVRRDRHLAFWFAWFFVWLLLSFNFGQLGAYLLVEKWLYLPAAGMCVVAAAVLLRLRLGPTVLVAVLLVHFGTVVVRSTYWRSQLSYFEQLVASTPDLGLARYMLGNQYVEQRDFAKAADEFAATVRLDPKNSWAINNLGNCYWKLGDRDRAVTTWELAVSVDPGNYHPAYNVGMAAEASGDYAKAVRYYRLFLSRSKEPQPEVEARLVQLERRLSRPPN